METRHQETVFEKVTAYVKDMLGVSRSDRTPDVLAKPEYSDAPLGLADVSDARSEPLEFATQGGAPLDPEDVQLIRHVERH
jgi:hypothetical protein